MLSPWRSVDLGVAVHHPDCRHWPRFPVLSLAAACQPVTSETISARFRRFLTPDQRAGAAPGLADDYRDLRL
jgi:hypothetical protein